MTSKVIVNSTDAVVLARAVLAWWDEQPEALLRNQLFLKEPFFVREARAVLQRNRNRPVVQIKPGDGPKLVAIKGEGR